MSVFLSDQQRQALHEANGAGPVTVVDPATNVQFILLRADIYEQILNWMNDFDPQEAYPLIDRIMSEDDTADPTLIGYQNKIFREKT
jgi:hypothetical protein